MFFKFLNYRQSKKVQVLDKSFGREGKISSLTVKTISPPPPYAAIFNRSRFMTGSDLFYGQNPNNFTPTPEKAFDGSMNNRKIINGRDYLVVKDQGASRLIPMRVPSAALFQYSYTN